MVDTIINKKLETLYGIFCLVIRSVIFIMFIQLPLWASVTASIDRNKVELNETFTLKIIVDSAIDLEPDASPLEKDFYVGTRSQLTNTTIINGAISRNRTWSYALMPKRSGNITIPPVIVGNQKSQPINIIIAPQSESVLGRADIFISAEVDSERGFVQAQNIFRIKIYRNVQTRQPRLYEPEIKGVETVIEIVGDDRNYESIIDGKTYDVIERVYALFPQESGSLSIEPIRFEARILQNGSITGRRNYQSKEINIDILPIPSPPINYPNAAWLPAKNLEITEEWSRDLSNLKSGEPITRQITITAIGQLSTQLPVIDYQNNDLKIYPDKPKLIDFINADDMVASRIDQYAVIGSNPGEVELKSIQLPWWDINEETWKFATISNRSINIKPSDDDLVENEIVQQENLSEISTSQNNSDFWKNISGVLAAIWIFTILVWFYSKPVKMKKKMKPEISPHKKQEKLLRHAKKLASSGDIENFKQIIIEWAKFQWPDKKPLSLEQIASRVGDPLKSELRNLAYLTYGPNRSKNWNGQLMAKALKNISLSSENNIHEIQNSLPPLMPN